MAEDSWDALRWADSARKQQVRAAMRLEVLCHKLESLPNLRHLENSREAGREAAAQLRTRALERIDRMLARGDILDELITEAESELALLGPPTVEEMAEWREEFENDKEDQHED